MLLFFRTIGVNRIHTKEELKINYDLRVKELES